MKKKISEYLIGGYYMSKLLILGAGGHGKVVAEIALLMKKWNGVSFLDDDADLKQVIGIPVIGKLKNYELFKDKYKYAFVAIGNSKLRLKLLERLSQAGFIIPIIVHPFSAVSQTSHLGEGTVVMAGAVINASAHIGKGCIVNTCSSIDHDCILDDGVHISPGAHIGGKVDIGLCTWICIGSSVANNIKIGNHVVVAAGAAVIKNIPDNLMVAGVPAKKIKDLD